MIAAITRKMGRFQRSIRRYGILSAIGRLTSATFNRCFRARLCVWVWNAGGPFNNPTNGVEVNRYETLESLPQTILEELIRRDGEEFLTRTTEEFVDHGVLWVATVEGQVAGYQWSCRGDFVRNWHFELTASDVLIFSTVTFHEFRGRGIAGAILARICDEVPSGGRACADCMVWNTPAVRCFQKAGFQKVAERKPLPDHPD
ncbi:MAG: GNAT family N-acetyltransferase [Planctomycetaceae bacterium]|nr:GNAT family N-acetyltransferase [Planctomycetaceae bacterium]